jgi:Ca2+/H+ antiporter
MLRFVSPAKVERNPGFSQLALSRFVAVFLLLSYGAYLYYQLKSHSYLYEDKQDDAERGGNPIPHGDTPARLRESGGDDDDDDVPILGFWGSIGRRWHVKNTCLAAFLCRNDCCCFLGAAVALTLVTVVISVLSDYLVKAIEVRPVYCSPGALCEVTESLFCLIF